MKLKHTFVGAAAMSTDWAICDCMVEIGVGTCARKESSRTHSSLLGMASEIQSLTAAYFLPTLMRSRTGSSSNSLRLCERSPESYLAINNESWNTLVNSMLQSIIGWFDLTKTLAVAGFC